jgi:hypothetical protein
LKKKGTPAACHLSRTDRTQAASIGRAPAPLSPRASLASATPAKRRAIAIAESWWQPAEQLGLPKRGFQVTAVQSIANFVDIFASSRLFEPCGFRQVIGHSQGGHSWVVTAVGHRQGFPRPPRARSFEDCPDARMPGQFNFAE